MQRMLALIAALLLTALPILGQAIQPLPEQPAEKADVKGSLADVVKAFIQQEGYTSFSYDAEKGLYSGRMSLDNGIPEVAVDIHLYSDSMATYAIAQGLRVPQERREAMAMLVALINWQSYYGVMYLDDSTGRLMAGRMQNVLDVVPGVREVAALVHEPIWLLDDYAQAILAVNQGSDPREAFLQARTKLDQPAP